MRNCDTIDFLDGLMPSVGEQRLHVQALTTWQRWAQSHDVDTGTLRTALAQRPGLEQQLATTLRDELGGTPIEQAPHDARHVDTAAARITEPDLGIEL